LCNWVIQKRPKVVYLHKNGTLLEAIQDIRTILWASITKPTHCKDLVAGWPDYIGIVDASSHSVGGGSCRRAVGTPTYGFCLQWPVEILEDLVLFDNPGRKINNSNLEMAGLLLLWLCLEAIVPDLAHKHNAPFSNNLPTVNWVNKMA
jgi:hypothetical protein